MQTQDVRVVILPTGINGWKKGALVKKPDNEGGTLFIAPCDSLIDSIHVWERGYKPQRLYFTSDEEITGTHQYVYSEDLGINKAYEILPGLKSSDKLVIASTDPSLNLPSIPEEWIRNKYVPSNGKIDSVNLAMEEIFDPIFDDEPLYCLKLTDKNEICIIEEHFIINTAKTYTLKQVKQAINLAYVIGGCNDITYPDCEEEVLQQIQEI